MDQNIFFVHHFFEQTPWQVLAGLLVINATMQNVLLYVKVGGHQPPSPPPSAVCELFKRRGLEFSTQIEYRIDQLIHELGSIKKKFL